MATVYGSKVSSVWRSYLTYTVTDNPTNVVVSLVGGLNIPDAGYTSKRIFTSTLYNGSTSTSGTYNSSGSTLTGVLTQPIVTQTVTISKTGSAQSVTFKNTLSGSGTSTKSTASYTLRIPAETIYTVTYYANGGSGTVPSDYTAKVADSPLTLPTAPQSGLTRSGYTLVSWNTKADGSGTSYALGGSIPASTNADIELYAIWRKNYVAPTITNVQIFRTTSSGTTQTDDGTYVYIKFNYTNGVVDGTSTLPSCSIKIGTTTYNPTLSGGSFTNRYGTFSANNTYEVTITLSNTGYGTQATVYKATIPSATYPIDILGTGQSMGIMHVAVSGQKLTLPDTHIDGNLYFSNAYYSAAWIAESTTASGTQLTNILSLPKGTYFIVVATPYSSNTKATMGLRIGNATPVTTMSSLPNSSYTRVPYIIQITPTPPAETVDVYAISQSSASVDFSYTERGSITAIRLCG